MARGDHASRHAFILFLWQKRVYVKLSAKSHVSASHQSLAILGGVDRLTKFLLLLVAGQRVADRLASAAEAVLDRAYDALALFLGAVTAGAGSISGLLRHGFVALGLHGSSDLVTKTRGIFRRLLGRRLLGVGSDLLSRLLAKTLAEAVRHVD